MYMCVCVCSPTHQITLFLPEDQVSQLTRKKKKEFGV